MSTSTHVLRRPAARSRARGAATTGTGRAALRIGFVALAAFFAVITVLPLLVLVKVSISAPEDVMTGHPPFQGVSWQEVLGRHALDPVPPVRSARPTVPPADSSTTTGRSTGEEFS